MSNDGVEIYLRHSGGRALLMFHVPAHLREQFQQAMLNGMVDGRQIPIAFEAPVLPEWMLEPDNPQHMRLNVDQISIQLDDDAAQA